MANYSRSSEAGEQNEVLLGDAIRDALKLVQHGHDLTNVSIRMELSDTKPIIASRTELCQIFVNLISNSSQALDGHGTITLITNSNDEGTVAIVKDTGPGIATHMLPRIFDPFYTTKPEGQGTGLGLSIVKHLVGRIGGTIEVTSEVGRSTIFTITIPKQD